MVLLIICLWHDQMKGDVVDSVIWYMWWKTYLYTILAIKLSERPIHRWETDIKMNFKEIECE